MTGICLVSEGMIEDERMTYATVTILLVYKALPTVCIAKGTSYRVNKQPNKKQRTNIQLRKTQDAAAIATEFLNVLLLKYHNDAIKIINEQDDRYLWRPW